MSYIEDLIAVDALLTYVCMYTVCAYTEINIHPCYIHVRVLVHFALHFVDSCYLVVVVVV